MAEQDDLVHRLNTRDEIVYVNDAWERFAQTTAAAGDSNDASWRQRIEFCSKTMFMEERVTQELFDSDVPRSEEMVRVCSWCNRVEQDGQWVDEEEAVRGAWVFERSRPPMMTHGICEICVQRMIDSISTE